MIRHGFGKGERMVEEPRARYCTEIFIDLEWGGSSLLTEWKNKFSLKVCPNLKSISFYGNSDDSKIWPALVLTPDDKKAFTSSTLEFVSQEFTKADATVFFLANQIARLNEVPLRVYQGVSK